MPFELRPIGVFRCGETYTQQAPRQGTLRAPAATGKVELFPGFGYDQALRDLAGMERIWLIYLFNQNKNWNPVVRTPRDNSKRGVFATRSPHRPNPVGLSCVRLLSVEDLTLTVAEYDLLDGTPIIDIKPYLPYADSFPDASTGWLEEVRALSCAVDFTPDANTRLDWIAGRTGYDFRAFLLAQLSENPADGRRKRVKPVEGADGRFVIAGRTWRAGFTFDADARRVTVDSVFGGYAEAELASGEDKYGDKDAHREFVSRYGRA
jgi:tRNA-Thr(GGU) m(6)t(6)A37 methyltransferase TsaA